jgi:AcrR family transcriptional regulator
MMAAGSTPITHAVDRRVRRSRTALMRAAVAVVSERQTADVTVSEIAEAADVSRQLVYQHFSDRDTLLLEAALDLAERELVPLLAQDPQAGFGTDQLVAVVSYFAQHRPFYRAMLKSSCGYDLSNALNGMVGRFNQRLIDLMSTAGLEQQVVEDLALFVTGGWAAVINRWLIEAPDPLDASAASQRLVNIFLVIIGSATGMARSGSPASTRSGPPPHAVPRPRIRPASAE